MREVATMLHVHCLYCLTLSCDISDPDVLKQLVLVGNPTPNWYP